MKRVSPLPSLLTLANFCCGFIALVLCFQAIRLRHAGTLAASDDMIEWACAAVFFAMIFDMLDGRVARLTGAESRFGAELDSLADCCTFGIVPPAILCTLWIRHQPDYAQWWSAVMVCGMVYASCAVLRLARYNVEHSDKNWFTGLPSPAAAGVVASTVLFARQPYLDGLWQRLLDIGVRPEHLEPMQAKILAIYMLVIGLLMVTRLRFMHVANKWLSGRKRFTFLVAILFGLALLWLQPREMLFFIFNGYVLTSLLWNVRRELRERRALAPAAPEADA